MTPLLLKERASEMGHDRQGRCPCHPLDSQGHVEWILFLEKFREFLGFIHSAHFTHFLDPIFFWCQDSPLTQPALS